MRLATPRLVTGGTVDLLIAYRGQLIAALAPSDFNYPLPVALATQMLDDQYLLTVTSNVKYHMHLVAQHMLFRRQLPTRTKRTRRYEQETHNQLS